MLEINGLNLSVSPEIHFYNANMERAVVRQATLDSGVATVTIPNALLQEALTIKADVCIYEDNVRKTIENIEIPVKAKARPLDYVFEDDGGEIYSYNALQKDFDLSKERYNALIDEMGRIIGDYPSVPDRVAELENNVKAMIQYRSYVGTGNAGSNAPCSLTFDSPPKLIFWISPHQKKNTSTVDVILIDELTTQYQASKGFTSNLGYSRYAKKSTDEKTIYWYCGATNSDAYVAQLNEVGTTYGFLAVYY